MYGEDRPIVKEECVNHVAKRLWRGLKDVVRAAKQKKYFGWKQARNHQELNDNKTLKILQK